MRVDIASVKCGIYLFNGDIIILREGEERFPDFSRNVYRVTIYMDIIWQISSERDGPGTVFHPLDGSSPVATWPYGHPFSGLCRIPPSGKREWVSWNAHSEPPQARYTHYQKGDIILAGRWDSYNYKLDLETGRAEIFEFEK